MSEERKKLGYNETKQEIYEKRAYQPENADICKDYIANADAVIFGGAPEEMIRKRIISQKPVFRYSERLFKKGNSPLKYFLRRMKVRKNNPESDSLYLLCASAYTAADFASFGLFKNKAYKWGYFPETKRYDDPDALFEKKDAAKILWCGRFLDWKHPEDALKAAVLLKKDGLRFTLEFDGTGIEEENLRAEINKEGLSDCVKISGSKHPEEIRASMEQAGIYLFTSDFSEGWGAVLNEAMNSGCAVVASHAAGATPYLVENGKNGFIYKSGDVYGLYEKIKYLLENPDKQREAGKNAYLTITQKWNADVAAERLLKLTEKIISGENPDIYPDGPCSKAEILKNNWWKK